MGNNNKKWTKSIIDKHDASLGALICNLVTLDVPQGIVAIFSSFDYEECVYTAWKASGILGKIMKKKRVFSEPRNNTVL